MTEYGVQTNNIFDLLNAADEGKSASAAKPKPRKKQGGAQSAPKKDQSGGAKPSGQRPASTQVRATTVTVSGGRGSGRSPAAPAGNAGRSGSPAQQQRPLTRVSEDFVRRHDESHVSFAEEKAKPVHGRYEGAPAVKHNPPNHGREFDRHSGTGRSLVENKKGGAGQGNWGKNSADEELAAVEDVKAELAESGAAKDEKKKKKKKGKKPEEEEEKEKKDEIPDEQLKTLDDFLKEKAAKATKLSLPPPRTAGEGVKADPKWADAVKREDNDEVFVKVKEEPKKELPTEDKKPSKSALRKKRKKQAKEAAVQKLAVENITNMFDFSAKKEDFPRGGGRREGGRGPRRDGPPREGGRGPREGGQRGPREGGQRGPREGGQRGPREGGQRGSGPRGNVQPRKYKVDSDNAGAQFDESAFPALQVGPPPITAD